MIFRIYIFALALYVTSVSLFLIILIGAMILGRATVKDGVTAIPYIILWPIFILAKPTRQVFKKIIELL